MNASPDAGADVRTRASDHARRTLQRPRLYALLVTTAAATGVLVVARALLA